MPKLKKCTCCNRVWDNDANMWKEVGQFILAKMQDNPEEIENEVCLDCQVRQESAIMSRSSRVTVFSAGFNPNYGWD